MLRSCAYVLLLALSITLFSLCDSTCSLTSARRTLHQEIIKKIQIIRHLKPQPTLIAPYMPDENIVASCSQKGLRSHQCPFVASAVSLRTHTRAEFLPHCRYERYPSRLSVRTAIADVFLRQKELASAGGTVVIELSKVIAKEWGKAQGEGSKQQVCFVFELIH